MQALLLLLVLALGIAETFFGYRIFRILVVVVGLLLGWTYGPALLAGTTAGPVSAGATLAAALVGAVVAGLLAWFAFRFVVALYGFAVGWSLGLAAFAMVLPALLVGILGALVAFLATRPAIIVLTALNGAWITVGTVLVLLGRLGDTPPIFFVRPPDLPLDRPLWLVVVLALAAVGAAVQWRQGAHTVGDRTPRRRT